MPQPEKGYNIHCPQAPQQFTKLLLNISEVGGNLRKSNTHFPSAFDPVGICWLQWNYLKYYWPWQTSQCWILSPSQPWHYPTTLLYQFIKLLVYFLELVKVLARLICILAGSAVSQASWNHPPWLHSKQNLSTQGSVYHALIYSIYKEQS